MMAEAIGNYILQAYDEETHRNDDQQIAIIGEKYADGLSLIFDGASEPSKKHYKCNSAITFSAGQRVKIARISGTFIVEYPIGFPT